MKLLRCCQLVVFMVATNTDIGATTKKNTMKKIYLSGKISGLPINQAIANFQFAKFDLRRIKADLINPLDIKPFLGIKTWLCYMIADIYQLRKCDTIAMLPNWPDSKGAVIEYYAAKFIFKHEIIFL